MLSSLHSSSCLERDDLAVSCLGGNESVWKDRNQYSPAFLTEVRVYETLLRFVDHKDAKLTPIFRGQWRILSASCRSRHASFSLPQILGSHFQKFSPCLSGKASSFTLGASATEWFFLQHVVCQRE